MNSLYLFPPNDNTPKKTCTGMCGRTLDATTEFFHSDNTGKYGLHSRCKECRSKKSKIANSLPEKKAEKKAYNKAYRNRPEVSKRLQLYKKAYYKQPEVRTHTLKRQKAYQNRPNVQAHRRAYGKAYYNRPDVREHVLARQKDYYYRPEIREYKRVYSKLYHSHLDVQERNRVRNRTRRSLKKSIKGTYTPLQIKDQLKRQKHKCYYCQKRLQKAKGKYIYHIEHTFPLSRVAGTDIPANDISYLVLACPTCNLSKGDKFPWEWANGGRLC